MPTTDQLIEQAAQRISAAQNISDEALVTFTVSEIEPVIHYMAKQERLIQQLKDSLLTSLTRCEGFIDLINALEKEGRKEHE